MGNTILVSFRSAWLLLLLLRWTLWATRSVVLKSTGEMFRFSQAVVSMGEGADATPAPQPQAERGFEAVSAEELVAKADVTRGALYHHYDGKGCSRPWSRL